MFLPYVLKMLKNLSLNILMKGSYIYYVKDCNARTIYFFTDRVRKNLLFHMLFFIAKAVMICLPGLSLLSSNCYRKDLLCSHNPK